MDEDIKVVADDYIDKFINSDLSLIKISDEKYSRMELRNAISERLIERKINTITAYTFMNGLYLEKE